MSYNPYIYHHILILREKTEEMEKIEINEMENIYSVDILRYNIFIYTHIYICVY